MGDLSLCNLPQDSSTKAVIETPPSETWQIKFQPQSDSLIIAAAGGSSRQGGPLGCGGHASQRPFGNPISESSVPYRCSSLLYVGLRP